MFYTDVVNKNMIFYKTTDLFLFLWAVCPIECFVIFV